MPERWNLTLQIELQTAFHTFGPGFSLPLIDQALQVDPKGYPMIPASSVRGRVRAHLERLLKAMKEPVCTPPRPDRTCPHDPAIRTQLDKLDEPYCRACRIFGSVWRDAAIVFNNFYLIRDGLEKEETIADRTSVGISRRLASAQAERLFVRQTTAPGQLLRFTGKVEGWLPREELGWLLAAIRCVSHLGGGKARGLGRISLNIVSLQRWEISSKKWISQDPQLIVKEVIENSKL
jgi:CRISPR/Cas system CSM-associated protein Csm3 (group 7 of RAMP superfamily)